MKTRPVFLAKLPPLSLEDNPLLLLGAVMTPFLTMISVFNGIVIGIFAGMAGWCRPGCSILSPGLREFLPRHPLLVKSL